ncbi:hypothetical protein COI93_19050 [Bacillus cereus]|uniref:PD-(D/E)XK endonuclease-like domain-containing protein n=1 Tax=Bacillus cereus TaxID=1396 RepID=A0A2B0LWL0_BACCE|nr:hypothetical protein COI93_19050 [Bacillus cereus]
MKVYCSPYTENIESFIKKSFNLNKKTLHIVPTLILYKRRSGFYIKDVLKPYLPSNLKTLSKDELQAEINEYVALNEMDQFLKTVIYTLDREVLSKNESSIILERLLIENDKTNNLAWTSAINDLLSLFFQMSESGLSLDEIKLLESSKQWELITTIYNSYIEELKRLNKIDIGLASSIALDEIDLSEYDELIMDGGFLPILPKHHRLIKRFVDSGKPIKFFIPFDMKSPENPALHALKTVYESYQPVHEWNCIQENTRSSSFFINALPKTIFQNEGTARLDRTFHLLKFATIEEEIHYIIRNISVLVKSGQADPRKVAIVTPNPMEMRPLVREISELYGLDADVPERPLLHLPKGRGIKTLIDIFVDNRRFDHNHYLDLKMVEDLLQSTLLKTPIDLYTVVKKFKAFFNYSNTFEQWYNKIEELLVAKQQIDIEQNKFHPLLTVRVDDLLLLKEAIKDFESLSEQIFSSTNKTISQHTKHIIEILTSHPKLNSIEEEILEKITDVGEAMETQTNIQISPLEYGKRISSFFIEPEDKNADDVNKVSKKPREVLVTGPNNIEFQSYEYVFLCRFTQDMYPEPHRYIWPMDIEIERNLLNKATKQYFDSNRSLNLFYLNRGLYHFYLVLHSSSRQLTLSYSDVKDGIELSHAHYLHDIAKVFGIEEGNRLEDRSLPSLEDLLMKHKVLKQPDEFSLLVHDEPPSELVYSNFQTRSLSIEDLAVFKFCPKRFYYEKSYPNERIYTDNFHLTSYAAAILYEAAVKEMITKFPEVTEQIDTKKTYNTMFKHIPTYIHLAEEKIYPLFPLSRREWHDIEARTQFYLKTLIRNIFNNSYLNELRLAGQNNIRIRFSINEIPVKKTYRGFTIHVIQNLEIYYNNAPCHRYSISNFKDFLSFSSSKITESERVEEIKKWYFDTKRQFYKKEQPLNRDISDLIDTILLGKFTKIPGGHCTNCNFYKWCQQREVNNSADINN